MVTHIQGVMVVASLISTSQVEPRDQMDFWFDVLSNPTRRTDEINQIALRWGISEGSHFSRVFRFRFGLSARDY
jgi:AraC-like DNA-binding protein